MLDVLFSFLLLPIPEYGTSLDYSGYPRTPAQAPIRIDACEASDQQERGLVARTRLKYGAAFTIVGSKPARRVRLRFTFVDKAWHPLSTSDVEVTGVFSPGSTISRTHRNGGNFTEKRTIKGTAAVVCSPDEIEFTDGTIWHGPTTPETDPE